MKTLVLVSLLSLAMLCRAAEPRSIRVALVFDDGPKASDNAPLLAVLKQENVKATFSLIGKVAAANPDAAKAIILAGHEVINHSMAHAHPGSLSDSELKNEISGGQKVIAAAAGVAPRWYWPPFLERNARVEAAVKEAGLVIYVPKHLVATMDFDTSYSAADIYRRATTGVEDGSVILFHEWRKDSRDQLPAIIAELRRQGARFMTFSELAASLAAEPVPALR